ncbi:Chitin synthase, class 3 [Entophlyctis luteolus]|nr:Chitin synthase, class 3 [Entophlyctis luteolus]
MAQDSVLPKPTLPYVGGFLEDDEADIIVLPDHLNGLLRAGLPEAPRAVLPSESSPCPLQSTSSLSSDIVASVHASFQPAPLTQQQPSPHDKMTQIPMGMGLGRRKTLTRSSNHAKNSSGGEDIFNSLSRNQARAKKRAQDNQIETNAWVYTSWILTCCIPSCFIDKCLKKPDKLVQQAFREKVALCTIIAFMMAIVGFLTFGFQNVACPNVTDATIHLPYTDLKPSGTVNMVAIHGILYTTISSDHVTYYGADIKSIIDAGNGGDFGSLFPPLRNTDTNCAAYEITSYPIFPCTAVIPYTNAVLWPNSTIVETFTNQTLISNPVGGGICHPKVDVKTLLKYEGNLVATYANVQKMHESGKKIMVLNGNVLDVSPFFDSVAVAPDAFNASFFGADVLSIVQSHIGKDATRAFANAGVLDVGACMSDYLKIAVVDSTTPACLAATIEVWVSLMVILFVVLAQFFLALYFKYAIGWTLGSNKAYRRAMADLKRRRTEFGRAGEAEVEAQLRARRADIDGDITPYNPFVGAFGASMGKLGGTDRILGSIDNSFPSSASITGVSAVGTSAAHYPASTHKSLNKHSGIGSSYPSRSSPLPGFSDSRTAAHQRESRRDVIDPSRNWNAQFGFLEIEGPTLDAQTSNILNDPTLMHCLCLVTAYSEGESSLKATLNSIAHCYYPGTHKCLFVISDGIVKGSENDKSTPEILVDMIDVDERFPKDDPRLGGSPQAYSYVAIANGVNRKNYAKVYAGYYKHEISPRTEVVQPNSRKSHVSKKKAGTSAVQINDFTSEEIAPKKISEGRVPMLLIVKVGNDEERNPEKPAAKPGNRGKRDSQVLLMNFLSKVMFDDRMTELEFDIFFKLFTITGVNPEKYEALLMVDADTRIYLDALSHMIACLLKDDRVIGICGETKISNKWDSWVTMIQVFEYFISHHMTKAFESVFGGVTCLPGCFSMYRIKTPKGPNGFWVPILANPDVVEEYSEHIVDTLHKKNLLLLGEDRYLSTIMLRTFPKRRMRRRWINSTIHNMMELLLVKDLCGTFCISMQVGDTYFFHGLIDILKFVIFMNLVGTLVLPAAISFTITILILTVTKVGADTALPLILLALILGLPAVLILFTANRPIYIFWMAIYLLSLPIWNFVLPMYAFWHFDDFSWGATRRVAGEDVGHDHSKRDGEFTGDGINMKRWSEWVKNRRMEHERLGYERDPIHYEQKRSGSRSSQMFQSPLVLPPSIGTESFYGSIHASMPGPHPLGLYAPPSGQPHPPRMAMPTSFGNGTGHVPDRISWSLENDSGSISNRIPTSNDYSLSQ